MWLRLSVWKMIAAFGPVVITKGVDSATPKLLVRSATGTHIPTVKIHWLRKNPLNGLEEPYFTAQLEDVVITALRTRLADQRDPQSLPGSAVEEVSFTFVRIQLFFLRSDGAVVSGGYDTRSREVIN
jgi:type VI secretion system Hcp family effector